MFDGVGVKFVSVGGFPSAETTCDAPYLLPIVFIPLDELGREIQAFSNGYLKGGDTVVVADEVVGDSSVVEVEIGVLTCLQSNIQMVFGVVNMRTHRCTVSFPSDFADLDGGDKSGDDFAEGFSGDFVVSGKGGKDGVWRHWGVLVENGGRGVILCGGGGKRVLKGALNAALPHGNQCSQIGVTPIFTIRSLLYSF